MNTIKAEIRPTEKNALIQVYIFMVYLYMPYLYILIIMNKTPREF